MGEQGGGPWIDQWAAAIDGWPRLLRMALSLIFAIVLTALAFIPLDTLIFDSASGDNLTLATVVMLVVGVIFYVAGWWALVGFDNNLSEDWHAGPPAVWCLVALVVGTVVLVVVVVVMAGGS